MSTKVTPPERPHLTINIGIVGHRKLTPESEPEIRSRVAEFLSCVQEQVRELAEGKRSDLVQELYISPVPRFVLLSALAAGADSIVAEEALRLGYELHVPLPMSRSEYGKDFTGPGELSRFQSLLACASRTYEICAANPERSHAYADASRVVLNHSDVMLALWDKKDTEFVAGTAATLESAVRQHIPVVHIHPDSAVSTSIIIDNLRYSNWRGKLQEHIGGLLLPVEAHSDNEADPQFARSCAQQETVPPMKREELCWFEYIVVCAEERFKKFLQLRRPTWMLTQRQRRERAEEEARREEAKVRPIPAREPFTAPAAGNPSCPKCTSCPQKSVCRKHQECPPRRRCPACHSIWNNCFAWFDALANAYSARYRGGLVLRYVSPVLATICLACALYWGEWTGCEKWWLIAWKTLWFLLQAYFLYIPLSLQKKDRKEMWHRKFFSYRVMGEQMRQSCFLGPIGFFLVRNKESTYRNSPQRWTAWYYRALIRDAGLPEAVVNRGYISSWMQWVRNEFVVDQLNYHRKRARREGGMCRRLVRAGVVLFLAGIVFACVRGGSSVLETGLKMEHMQDVLPMPTITSVFSAAALIVPAMAVFFAGFCAYACYAKDQQVSLASAETLDTIRRELDTYLKAEGYDVTLPEEDSKYIQTEPLHFTRAYNIAEQIHSCCKGELLGWEDLISTRGIKGQ